MTSPHKRHFSYHSVSPSSAFTLIELLVVIAIIAILAVVVVLTLNPAQLLAQSRDANRVSDMATLNSALSLYQIDSGGTGSLGTSSIVYTSLSDTSSTCGNLNLPILPSGYTYNCTNSTSTRNINNTGWIPINFQTISSGAPFGSLPVDPTNTSSSRLYYTYDTNGSQYEVTASMESSKYKLGGSNDVISSDGGTLASVYEKGTGLGLEPLDYGDSSLVGYWPMNEGSGSTSGVTQAYDRSGNGNNGTWYGTPAGTSGYYSPGKVGAWAGTFDGSTNYLDLGAAYSSYVGSPVSVSSASMPSYTISTWMNSPTTLPSGQHQVVFGKVGFSAGILSAECSLWDSSGAQHLINYSPLPQANTWYLMTMTYNQSTQIATCYENGSALGTINMASLTFRALNVHLTIGGGVGSGYFAGLIDDARIYNRALSAAEIQAMYNAGK
jgi:prepilin-type N-terminal cleavage/methylation domain-containing protein